MKRKIAATDSNALAREIAALREATPSDLKNRWRNLYGTEPPPRISRDLLTRALAHRITGTKWSGPLFFGLKADRREHADGSR